MAIILLGRFDLDNRSKIGSDSNIGAFLVSVTGFRIILWPSAKAYIAEPKYSQSGVLRGV
jgi:hypothetical protein